MNLVAIVLAFALEQWRGKYPEVRVRQDVIRGHPGRVLASYSARADLVVLGRHGHPAGPGPASARSSTPSWTTPTARSPSSLRISDGGAPDEKSPLSAANDPDHPGLIWGQADREPAAHVSRSPANPSLVLAVIATGHSRHESAP